jgi:hypothetical protein
MAEDNQRDDEESTEEGAVETSLEEFLQRRERGGRARTADEADDEEALLDAMDEREGRGAESLTVKVVPEQPDEFTCRRCFLVKHRTQLKDRRRMLCADCA